MRRAAVLMLGLVVLWACWPSVGRAAGPRGLTARAVSARSIRLQWQGGTRVAIDRKTAAGAYKRVGEAGADQRTYLDGGLAEGTAYTYRLRRGLGGVRYDFGPGGSPAKGYVRVRVSDVYTPRKGYGIVPDAKAKSAGERHRGGRAEPKLATLVWQHPTLTFVKDLPDGEYLVSLACGDATYEGSASVTLNGREVVPLTKTGPGKFVTVKDRPVTVSGGKLTVRIGGHGRINCLEIQPRGAKTPAGAEATATTFSLTASPGGTAYYVDAAKGDDGAKGTSPQQAWKTAARINALKLAPGDKVLLKSGCEYAGPLAPSGSGAEGKPIVVDQYGRGARPVLAGRGVVENTVRLHNQHHWEIRNLTVTNTDGGGWDDEGRKIRRAVYVTAEDAGDVEHIYLKNLEIRDVRGMYRFADSQTNGGIVCQVLGTKTRTRFVDLRIEGCVFRTKSIDRYPVVVTSSWKKACPCEVVYRNNTLDHAGRAHIVIPADQWPRKNVYYFCGECRRVFGLSKTAAPICAKCGRVGCEDIFSEMAARLKRSWSFFEATRYQKDRWLFKHTPGAKGYSVWATGAMALGYYGELRALGFAPPWADREGAVLDAWLGEILKHRDAKDNLIKGPGAPSVPKTIDKWGYLSFGFQWQLRNRVFLAKRYQAPPGAQVSEDFCRSKAAALKLFDSLPWAKNPYWACNMIGSKAILNHCDVLRAAGKNATDEVVELLHKKIDAKYNPEQGYWGGEKANHSTRANGNMKMLVTYAVLDWEIPNPKKIIDFTLSGANDKAGFTGRGCGAFNQMFSLAAVRRKYPELQRYRGEEIDRYTAMTFMTFLGNWNEKLNFYSGDWNGKHNNGVPLFMPHLMLDQPYMRASTIYNWRHCPMIARDKDGRVKVNKVIYHTEGCPFTG